MNRNGTNGQIVHSNGTSHGPSVPVFQFRWQLDNDISVGAALHAATRRIKGVQIDSPRLDSELLLGHVLGWTRVQLYTAMDRKLTDLERTHFEELVERRVSYEPIAYLLGEKSFYGLDLYVDRRVLIPRPETELLVDLVLDVVGQADHKAANGNGSDPAANGQMQFADIGAGSGAVSLAVATNAAHLHVCGVDISPDALEVARSNARRHNLDNRVSFLHGDLLDPLTGQIDVVAANLPYIAANEWDSLAPDITSFEPGLALSGGEDGLDLIRRLIIQSPAKLRSGGVLLLEIGATQGAAVVSLARQVFPDAQIEVVADYGYHDRIVRIQT